MAYNKTFAETVTAANAGITDYASLSAQQAGEIAKVEAYLTAYPDIYDKLIKTTPDQYASALQNSKRANVSFDGNVIETAVNNLRSGNTLLDPASLSSLKDTINNKKLNNDTNGMNIDAYIGGVANSVADNIYLVYKMRGTGKYTRNAGETFSRADANVSWPYTLNPNYVPQDTNKTLSGGSVVRDQQGNITTINGKPVTSGAGSTTPVNPTTPTTPTNPYQNADGSYNTTAINNFLKAFGYGDVEVPELKGFSAVDPLAGKSLSDRDLKVLEAAQSSGLKDLLTNEFYKSIVNGTDYATWAEANGMTEANGFSKAAFDKAYGDAAKAKNETLSQQYKNSVNALYQALGAEDNIIAQELRKAAAQAQASRASAGMAAANQLSAALSRTQQNSDEALKIAQSGIELGKEMAENDAAAIVEALNKWTATHQKNVELKNNADSNRVQGGAAVLGYAGDVVNAETAADQTRTNSALQTNMTNQSAVAAENTAKTDIYSTKKGAQSSILNSLIDGNVNQAMNNATNKTNLAITDKNNEANMLETMAALGEKGYTFKGNKVYDKNGKVIYG